MSNEPEPERINEGDAIPQQRQRIPANYSDSNPSPVMGGGNEGGQEDVPFLMNPRRVPAQPQTGGQIDYNPSPNMMAERNHQVWLLEDDPGIAREDDPNYRLVKPDPNAPKGPSALIEYYIENAITAVTMNDKPRVSQMVAAAKTLISMGVVQAKKVNDEALIKKMENYTATINSIETSLK